MKWYQKYLPILTVIVLVVAWWGFAAIKDYSLLYPKLSEIFSAMIKILGTKTFYSSLLGSLSRVVLSFFIALFLAIALAILSFVSKSVERLLYPVILLIKATPTMCVIFLCILWFKQSVTPMVVASAVIFPTMYGSVLGAIKSCDKDLLEMSKVYKVPTKIKIMRLYIPFVSERVYADATSIISLNVKLIIAAETMAQTRKSLGVLMQMSYAVFETASLFAYTLAAIILSFLLETLLKLIGVLLRRLRYAKIN